uniref:Si:ch211-194b1.1 n=1 Tax=Cyprinus carpio TaxID=7962 RepID=A0A8C1M5R9_CYPCA
MEPEDDLSTRDPQDLMSSRGLLPSASTSLLSCTFLGGLLHCDDTMEKGDGNGDSDGPKCFSPTLEQCGKAQRSPRSSAFPSSLTWDSDSEKETLDEEELQHFSNPHGLAAHSPGIPSSGQQEDRFDIVPCQEPVEIKHLFLEKIPLAPLEVENQGDVTYNEPKTTESSLPKHTAKLEQGKVSHLPDTTPKEGCQKEEKNERKMLNSRGRKEKNAKEPDVYTFPGDSEPESPPPGPWAHCTFIQRRRKKRAILRPFSGLDTWKRTTGAGRRTRGKPSGSKELRKTTTPVVRFQVSKPEKGFNMALFFLRRWIKVQCAQGPGGGLSGSESPGKVYTSGSLAFFSFRPLLLSIFRSFFSSGAGVYRTSPRFQQKSCKKGQVQSSADVTSTFVTSPLNKRYPIRTSKKSKETHPESGPSQVDSSSLSCQNASATPREATDQPDKATLPGNTDPAEELRRTEEARTTVANLVEENVPQPQHLMLSLPNPRAAPRHKDVAFKSIGNKRTVRATRGKLGRTRASTRLDPKSTLTPVMKKQVQISNQNEDKGQIEDIPTPEPEHDPKQDSKTVANFDPSTFSVMRCEFCSAGFDTRAGLSSHARAHLRDFGITNWEVTVSPINILRELFAKHPDLVLPTTTTHTLQSDQEQNSDEEQESRKDMKDEENLTAEPPTLSSDSPKLRWKEEHSISELEGGEEVEDGEEEEEEAQIPVTDKLATSPGEKTLFSIEERSLESKETDAMGSNLLKCEFCGATFETRRGLSSHARSHLRQLGIGMSENSGAPIDLLYQITKERSIDAHFTGTSSTVESPKKPQHHAPIVPIPSPTKDVETEEGLLDTKPTVPFSIPGSTIKVSSSPATHSAAGSLPSSPFVKSRSPSPVLRKAPISSLLPVSSPLRSQEHKTIGKNQSTNHSSPNKPFWAPQETDAPLNLTMDVDSKDIICQLCGAWFETRKGLSSHARAHLRHFGIEYSESKGSPIDLLNRFILTDDFKHRANSFLSDGPEDLRSQKTSMTSLQPSTSPKRSLPSSPVLYKTANSSLRTTIGSKASSSSTHSLLGPPPKKPKPSSLQVLRFSSGEVMSFPIEPMKDVGCEFCGELFENRKGLSSHARSHLRQLGITEWSVNGSPIDTLKEIIVRRGLPSIMPLKSPKSQSPGPSRPGNVLGRLPFHFAQTPSHDQPTTRKMSPATSTACSSPTLELVKLKPEPEIVEVTMKGSDMGVNESYNPEPLHSSLNTKDNIYPVNLVMTQEKEPSRDIRCEFCGEFFENRKGLSSHARSHLRHMGITEWSVNGSPIDTLWEVMRRQGTTPASVALGIKEEPGQDGGISMNSTGYQSSALSRKSPLNLLHSGSRLHKHGLGSIALSSSSPVGKIFGVAPLKKKVMLEEGQQGEKLLIQSKNFLPPPQDYSFKGKSSTEKHGVGHMDASCELCGFYFENRKALASHARAHLRQFGVTEWCVNGSPIETLSAWIRSRPQKAAEMQQSYAQGANYTQKKRCSSALSPSCDSDPTTTVSQKPAVAKWASLTLPQKRAIGRDVNSCSWGISSRGKDAKIRSGSTTQHGLIPQPGSHRSNSALPHAQVAHSELNVRLPRGFERRPLKHPSHAEGGEGESGPPKPRSSTIPALVPKPPSTPLVSLVGKIYSLKCRFCDVEFHGPLSVQEDWIRHLQQHILNLNYKKTASPANDTPAQSDTPDPKPLVLAATSTSTTTPSTPSPKPATMPTSASTPAPAPNQASAGQPATAEPVPSPAN